MARQIRKDASLKAVLHRAGVSPKALITPSGRKVRSDAKIETLRRRSK